MKQAPSKQAKEMKNMKFKHLPSVSPQEVSASNLSVTDRGMNDELLQKHFGQLIKAITRTDAKFKHADSAEKIEACRKRAEATLRLMNPQDSFEGMLIAQMVAIHNVAMSNLTYGQTTPGHMPETRGQLVGQGVKLCKSYTQLLETLMRYRQRDQKNQSLVVGRVDVHDGGQAIVGNMNAK